MNSQFDYTGAAGSQMAELLQSPTASESRVFGTHGQSQSGRSAASAQNLAASQGVPDTDKQQYYNQQQAAGHMAASTTGAGPQSNSTHPTVGPTATAPFLRDFNLVAEAAKRAQMAVVMRDLEAINL